jgi:prophage antirepressor-like protein
MSLVKEVYNFGEKRFEAWFLYVSGVVWIRAIDVCNFLEYKDPHQALRTNITNPNHKKTYEELTHGVCIDTHPFDLPQNWQNNTVFINEKAFNKLMLRSKKKEAEAVCDWVCDTVLPTLRKSGEFKINTTERDDQLRHLAMGLVEANKALIVAQQDAERARSDAIELAKQIVDLAKDVVRKPENPQLEQYLEVYHTDEQYVVLRRQRRSLRQAANLLKKKHPEAQVIWSTKTPNGIHLLNRTKEILSRDGVSYQCKGNKIIVSLTPDQFREKFEHVNQLHSSSSKKLKRLK